MDYFKSKKPLRDHLVSLTKELIRFPSHANEPRKIFELADFIKEYFTNDRLHISEYVFNGLPALIISTEDTKHPHLMLSGHIDVVPSSYVYSAKVDGDKLYGSGAMDMKSGVACMMSVMKYFAHEKNRPSLALMITSDEEVGGESTQMLLNEEGYNTDFCIVNESRQKYDIVNKEKGLLIVSITMKAKPIHSAYPCKGRNVTEDLMKLCLNIKAHFPKVREGWYPSVSVTSLKIGRGQEINTIPGEGEVVLCFRLTEKKKWSRDSVLALIKRLGPQAEVRELVRGDVFYMDPKDPHISLLKSVASEVTKKRIVYGANHGASDARFFSEKNISTAVLGPVGKDLHSPDEYVLIESMVTHFMVLKKFIVEDWKIFNKSAKEVAKSAKTVAKSTQ